MSTIRDDDALDDEDDARRAPALPGLLACWSDGAPRCVPLPLERGALEIGREQLRAAGLDDGRVSSHHLQVESARGGFTVRDLDSTNGSFLDGVPLVGERGRLAAPRVLRVGRTLLLLLDDVGPFQRAPTRATEDFVAGPRLQALRDRVERLAAAAQHVLLTGETGTGKEVMARAFHAAARRPRDPFVAVNCAAIPRDLAERLLFGARRGAFSGATDADGFLQAASGGTLFLDEVGELEPALQAKLLRALESREVLPLGATRPIPIDLRLCAATLRDLRREVARGQFRQDLYFRIGRPEVRLPPLAERLDEIPFHIERAARGVAQSSALAIGHTFVEACLLRRWPGNVRELCFETRGAAILALAEERALLTAAHLDPDAGVEATEEPEPDAADPQALRDAIDAEGGNLSRASERLSIPRSTLRRLLARHGIDLATSRQKPGEK